MKTTTRLCTAFLAAMLTLAAFPGSARAQAPAAPAPMSELEKQADPAYRASDWTKAATGYEAVVKAEPKNGRAHYRLGTVYLRLNNDQAAVKALEQAVALNFQPGFSNFNLACALARLNQKEQAIAALQAAVQGGFSNIQQIQSDNDLASLRSDARFTALIDQMNRAARPCEYDDHYKQFDYWVGDWYVRPVGTPETAPLNSLPQSRIEKIMNGCVVLENWMPSPTAGGGKSFNIYNAPMKRWEQYWVDSVGSAIHFVGGINAEGNMVYNSESTGPNGQKTIGRMTYFKMQPDGLRQLWETSTDGGKTWTVAFDGQYIRKK